MRLIDADALDSVVFRLITEGKQITRSEYKLIDSVIFEFPTISAETVEAISIEWIEKWLDEFLGTKLEEEITDIDPFKKNVYQGILLMYNDWRRGDGK